MGITCIETANQKISPPVVMHYSHSIHQKNTPKTIGFVSSFVVIPPIHTPNRAKGLLIQKI